MLAKAFRVAGTRKCRLLDKLVERVAHVVSFEICLLADEMK